MSKSDRKIITMTLLRRHIVTLEGMASSHGMTVTMGPRIGDPSISAMLIALADGRLSLGSTYSGSDQLAVAVAAGVAAEVRNRELIAAGIADYIAKNTAAVAKNQDKKPSIRGPLTVAKIPGWVPVGGWNHCGISYLESPKYLARQDSRSVDEWIDLGCTVGRGADSGGREIDVVVGLDDWVLSDSSIGEFLDSLKDLSIETE